MKRNIFENRSDDYIRNQYSETLHYLNSMNESLKYLPVQSVLGRWAINATIIKEQKRLDALQIELDRRGLSI